MLMILGSCREPSIQVLIYLCYGRSAPNHSMNGVMVDSPSKKTNMSVRLVEIPMQNGL